MENILALGKLLRLWFCFLLHSILFFISQTSYRTYKIISSYELARPIMGTIFLVYNNIYIRDSHLNRPESVSLASLARQLYCKSLFIGLGFNLASLTIDLLPLK